jgi:hypothetical protein
MTDEDDEFNRIEREASMRRAAVHATVTKKEWVGLADDAEILAISHTMPYADRFDFARAIEAHLKEKNT